MLTELVARNMNQNNVVFKYLEYANTYWEPREEGSWSVFLFRTREQTAADRSSRKVRLGTMTRYYFALQIPNGEANNNIMKGRVRAAQWARAVDNVHTWTPRRDATRRDQGVGTPDAGIFHRHCVTHLQSQNQNRTPVGLGAKPPSGHKHTSHSDSCNIPGS